jgi:hypothetical protein
MFLNLRVGEQKSRILAVRFPMKTGGIDSRDCLSHDNARCALEFCWGLSSAPLPLRPPKRPIRRPTRVPFLAGVPGLALIHNLHVQIERLNYDVAGDTLSGAYGVYSPTYKFEASHHLSPTREILIR